MQPNIPTVELDRRLSERLQDSFTPTRRTVRLGPSEFVYFQISNQAYGRFLVQRAETAFFFTLRMRADEL